MKILSPNIIFLVLLLCSAPAFSQLMQGGMPPGLSTSQKIMSTGFYQVAPPDLMLLAREDSLFDSLADVPWRFGENIALDLHPGNSGQWSQIDDQHFLWQLGLHSPGAQSLNLVFYPFRLEEGDRLFVYSSCGQHILGAFDHRNNQPDGYFATSLIFAESIVVEWVQPLENKGKSEVVLSQITYGYRSATLLQEKAFGDSGFCNINVACDVAQQYQDEARAVALMLVGSNSFCTGALINNTRNDGTPYFLSASHCFRTPSTVVVWFNWQSLTCENPAVSPPHQALSGTVQRARFSYNNTSKTGSDMWLLELNHLPPYEYNPYYLGWNRTEDPVTVDSVVAIHHPRGDIKKFSWSTDSLQVWGYGNLNKEFDTHWRVKSWDAGTTTEGGSSGSPLLDQQGRILGQLHGGQAACGNTLPDWYGRFAVSWIGGGTPATRLHDWLDADNLNPLTLEGFQPQFFYVQTQVQGNGNVSPSQWVMQNRSTTILITPQEGNFLFDVIVDGESVGPVQSYTFENIVVDHTVLAVFQPLTFTIIASAGPGGVVSPDGQVEVAWGSDPTFTITPDPGYAIAMVMVDGEDVGAVASYTFENVASDHTLTATFEALVYTITASAGPGGSISPDGDVQVAWGSDPTFTITPDPGYAIATVMVDGEDVGAVASYTFENVASDHTLTATFEALVYTISASAGPGGVVSPDGQVEVAWGEEQTFTITPDPGYAIATVMVDGEDMGAVASYTFENVTSDHTLSAFFIQQTFSLTFVIKDSQQQPLAGAQLKLNGELMPSGQYAFTELLPGTYSYEVSLQGYFPVSGQVWIEDQDVVETVLLLVDDTQWKGVTSVQVQIYPNPARNKVYLVSSHTLLRVELFDLAGRMCLIREFQQNEVLLELSSLDAGLYVLRLTSVEGVSSHKLQLME
ncbi:MAG: InlB B-repeat-containing protein [Bacteroidales bacterium]